MLMDARQFKAYGIAKELDGLKEVPGKKHNPEVVKFFAEVGHDWVKDDETAWCAAFVGAMLNRAGLEGTGKLNARSYLEWGEPIEGGLAAAKPGDLVVFWRGSRDGWQGHVGFYESHNGTHVMVFGGNQGNAVNAKAYNQKQLLGVRRMPGKRPPKMTLPQIDGTNAAAGLVLRIIRAIIGLFRR